MKSITEIRGLAMAEAKEKCWACGAKILGRVHLVRYKAFCEACYQEERRQARIDAVRTMEATGTWPPVVGF